MELIYEFMEQRGLYRLQQAMLDCLGMFRFRTMEKRLVRSFIIGNLGVKDGKDLITRDVLKRGPVKSDSCGSESGDRESGSGSSDDKQDNMPKRKKERIIRLGVRNNGLKSGNKRHILRRTEHDWYHFKEHGSLMTVTRRMKRVEDEQ